MKRKTLFIFLICILCAGSAFTEESPPIKDILTISLGEQNFILEKAKTAFAQQQGFMHRKDLATNRGMIFIYTYPRQCTFWMGYTKIPLDLIMLDDEGIITDIFELSVQKPRGKNETTGQYADRMPRYKSSKKILYAIEINQGLTKKLNIKKGDRISIPHNI